MEHIEKVATSKVELPRQDGLPQKSFTYRYKVGNQVRRFHFLGDGWTINHDGSLHGTPIDDIQLELAMVFESAAEASGIYRTDTGKFRIVGKDIQQLYIDEWLKQKRAGGQSASR